jgi:dienelactone hydrolase
MPSAGTGDPGRLTVVDETRRDLRTPEPRTWDIWLYPWAGQRRSYLADPELAAAMVRDKYYDRSAATVTGWQGRRLRLRGGKSAKPRPLILLMPGQGVAAFNYTFLAEALVARGFAVAVLDLPYLGYARGGDGTIRRAADDPASQSEVAADWAPRIADWEADLSASIDALQRSRYAGRIDFGRIVAAGHSLGGAVALDACKAEPRVAACADFEGAPLGTRTEKEGADKPVLFVLSRSLKPDRPVVAPAGPLIAFLEGRGTTRDAWSVAVGGGSHMSFSDAPLVMPDTITRFGGEVMSPARSMALYADVLAAFARSYLPRGGKAAAFGKALSTMPEVRTANVAASR